MCKKTTFLSISVALFTLPCGADIHTDGTVGRAIHLRGPHFQIGQDLGTLKGNNLFHSFDRFNLSKNESATFTGNNHIQNVISRVTGGDVSKIDGTLRSTIGKANFYFINPAGVVFGKNAHVNVPAAFYTSTASELKFADGARFSAIHPDSNTLSMARPEAFGFLGKQTGTIAFNGSHLEFKSGVTVQLSANKISMDNAVIRGNSSMDLQLAAVGSAKQTVGIKALPNQALQGDIALRNTRLVTEGNGKGRIVIRAGQINSFGGSMIVTNNGNKNMSAGQGIDIKVRRMTIKGTEIQTKAIGDGNAAAITVNSQGKLVIARDGNISTVTSAKGNAGNIAVKAGSIQIVGLGAKKIVGIIPLLDEIPTPTTGIYSKANSKSSGNSGTVQVTAKHGLVIVKGGGVFSYTASKGDAGDVDVKAGAIWLDGQGYLKADYLDQIIPIPTAGIFTEAAPKSTGNMGKVNVDSQNELVILNGGEIASANLGTGDSEGIEVNTKTLRIENKLSGYSTGIVSTAQNQSGGNAGGVKINVKNNLIMKGGLISSTSSSKGRAGDLDIQAGSIKIDGENGESWQRGINTASVPSNGQTGKVKITSKNELVLAHGGMIYASTLTNHDIDALNINAKSIIINGAGAVILARGYNQYNKKPAKIKISAVNDLELLDGAAIYSIPNYSGEVGDLEIKAEAIKIIGQKNLGSFNNYQSVISSSLPFVDSQFKPTNFLVLPNQSLFPGGVGKMTIIATKELHINNGLITNFSMIDSENPENIKANKIIIQSPDIELSNGGSIAADSNGNIPASSIEIDTKRLKLDNGSQITTRGYLSNGGLIAINAEDWVNLHNSQIISTVKGDKKNNDREITIKADNLVMDNGFIQIMNTKKNPDDDKKDIPTGIGGVIHINVKNLVASGGNLQMSGEKPLEFKADSGNNIIQAVGKGNVINNAPQLNIAGALVNLKTIQPDLNRAGRDPCSDIVRQSTVKKLGKGGVPVFHKGRDGLAIDSLLESLSTKHPTSQSSTLNAANQDCSPKHTQKPQPLAHKIG